MMAGTLALVGSGEYLPPMEAVDRQLLGRLGHRARVVCLPTAAGAEGEERIDYWSRLGIEHFTRLGVPAQAARVVDAASARDAALAALVASATFVYLSGGKPGYLHQTLSGSPVWEAILHVLDSGGVVAGCSAGAMIFGEHIPGLRSPWPMRPGFGLLPGTVIIPHFDEIPGAFVSGLRPLLPRGTTLIGIEGNTALVREDDGCTVAGSGVVTVWGQAGKVRYKEGQTVTWA